MLYFPISYSGSGGISTTGIEYSSDDSGGDASSEEAGCASDDSDTFVCEIAASSYGALLSTLLPSPHDESTATHKIVASDNIKMLFFIAVSPTYKLSRLDSDNIENLTLRY